MKNCIICCLSKVCRKNKEDQGHLNDFEELKQKFVEVGNLTLSTDWNFLAKGQKIIQIAREKQLMKKCGQDIGLKTVKTITF